MKYENNIKAISPLDMSLLTKSQKGRRIVKAHKKELGNGGVWLLQFLGDKLKYKLLVDFLFSYDLDVFDIEYGHVTNIYVCLKDDYRIQNSVVYAVFGEKK